MNGTGVVLIIAGYFLLLIIISRFTAGKGDNDTFFRGNKQSPWYVVAFGMIGASLSGVTFISVPGWVQDSQFAYMQMVFGYLAGYIAIAYILLPLYYRLNLTSIYTYLLGRFGKASYKTGASFFLISRIIGASFRLYLVSMVIYEFVIPQLGYDKENIPFALIVIITVALIWIYTNRGGIKTVIWTDTLQTACMLIAVVMTIVGIKDLLHLDWGGVVSTVKESQYSQIFHFDNFGTNGNHFIKQFLAGAVITIAMTGLDQDMMQKNLTCRNLKDARKNMIWFSVTLVFVNLIFLSLGALLYTYAGEAGLSFTGDKLFPSVAFDSQMGWWITAFFVLGLIASAYSSADSALTSLTTSFTIDILGNGDDTSSIPKKQRKLVHLSMSVVLIIVIVIFAQIKDESVIAKLFKVAGYTYGPLLGLYAFGLFTSRHVRDPWVPVIAVLSPVLCYVLNQYSESWFGYKIGFELLLINGLLTFIGLYIISFKGEMEKPSEAIDQV